jgi:hypothetical protein
MPDRTDRTVLRGGTNHESPIELTLVNNTKEQVEFQIVQLDEGHTLAEFLPALESDEGAIPPWLHALGGVGGASPGESRSTVVDLKAGSYAWFSNTTPEQEGAEPLYKRGGEGSLEVTGDPTGAQLPATNAQITAKEVETVELQSGQLRPALLPHRPGRRPAACHQGQDDPGGEGPLARCATVGGRCS